MTPVARRVFKTAKEADAAIISQIICISNENISEWKIYITPATWNEDRILYYAYLKDKDNAGMKIADMVDVNILEWKKQWDVAYNLAEKRLATKKAQIDHSIQNMSNEEYRTALEIFSQGRN